jgi:hypothetical protein
MEPERAKSEDMESSEESDSELEIVTTSEVRAGSASHRNYLLPSLKASYFPLKASIRASDLIGSAETSTQRLQLKFTSA